MQQNSRSCLAHRADEPLWTAALRSPQGLLRGKKPIVLCFAPAFLRP
ncbi:hypothetical protein PCL1606_34840 [Pseudomonas chlororaphis]|uniref:Uncharacterized protein n=1 Tax=Pseudomonas chlororaphis TaxID=587753 RepID=A0A0D5Y1K7_9PSED|nr:hypothetical protein PCL1606_34840 [Pseudomonas chlororaphis]